MEQVFVYILQFNVSNGTSLYISSEQVAYLCNAADLYARWSKWNPPSLYTTNDNIIRIQHLEAERESGIDCHTRNVVCVCRKGFTWKFYKDTLLYIILLFDVLERERENFQLLDRFNVFFGRYLPVKFIVNCSRGLWTLFTSYTHLTLLDWWSTYEGYTREAHHRDSWNNHVTCIR